MRYIQGIYGIIYKEILTEFRTKYAISALMLFILTSVIIVVMSIGADFKNPQMLAGLLWIILFFAASTGLTKSFVSEEEAGTSLFLKINADNMSVYFGKLLYNIIINLLITALSCGLMFAIAEVNIARPAELWVSMMFASIAISSAATIIAAIISKAGAKGAMFPVLSFPVLLPVLYLGIDLTINCISGNQPVANDIIFLISYSGAMIAASAVLFDFVWRE